MARPAFADSEDFKEIIADAISGLSDKEAEAVLMVLIGELCDELESHGRDVEVILNGKLRQLRCDSSRSAAGTRRNSGR